MMTQWLFIASILVAQLPEKWPSLSACPRSEAVAPQRADLRPGNRLGIGGLSSAPKPANKEPQGKYALRNVTAAGGTSREEAERVIRRYLKQLQACMPEDTHAQYDIQVHLAVGCDGRPLACAVNIGAGKTPALVDCLVKNLETVQFSAPRGQTSDLGFTFQWTPPAAGSVAR